jgi:hypothetical protein
VLRAEDRQFGLMVDEINDTEEIVVKPLRKQLKSVKVLAGASIMGDGRVALILDVLGVAQHAQLMGEGHRLATRTDGQEATAQDLRQTLLLFQVGADGRMAIHSRWWRASRNSSGPRSSAPGGRRWCSIADTFCRCCASRRLSHATPEADLYRHWRERLTTCPFRSLSTPGRRAAWGWWWRTFSTLWRRTWWWSIRGGAGVLGSAMIQHRVTDLVDIEGVVQALVPGFFEQAAGA